MSVSIGKALLERSAVNAKIQDIFSRISNNSIATKNENGDIIPSSENPEELFTILDALEKRYEQISNAILNANYNMVAVCDGVEYKIIEIIEKIEILNKKMKRIKE